MELFPSGSGDRIELGFSVVVRRAPGTRNPASEHQANKRSVDCALIDLQHLFTDLFDAASDSVTMQRSHGLEGLQDHQIKRALENIRLVAGHAACLLWRVHRSIAKALWDVNRKMFFAA